MAKITIYHSQSLAPAQIENHKFVSLDELKSWVQSGKIFFHLFRYRESRMLVHDLHTVSKPFATALLLWMLGRGRATREDRQGKSQQITVALLFSLFLQLVCGYFTKKAFLEEIKQKINLIKTLKANKLDVAHQPIYLRTDLCFGLQSGGSVGHIAGVLNHLGQFTGAPIFLTTDTIPTTSQQLESHIIAPGGPLWDFAELPSLHFNDTFLKQAIQIIGARRPSFIYQRYSMNNFSGIQLAQRYGVPFVLEFNGSEIWVNRHWKGSILKYEALTEQIERLNLQMSDLVVVVSRPLKEELIAKGIDPDKILVNPNGVDPDVYSPEVDGAPIRQKYGLGNKTVLGFIGTFGKWHGAEILAKAYAELLSSFPELKNRVCLMMIGDGMTMPLVKQILEPSTLKGSVIFTGTVPQESGPGYLGACDILAAPHVPNADGTPFFGSPTKLFEYMAMGKGIVASDLDQIGEVLEHGRSAWMVNPGDVQSLMRGLKKLIDDPPLCKSLGMAARREALSRYSWKEHTKKIIEILKEKFHANHGVQTHST
ncbi:MAG: glycosyltransferase [Chlamydiales bacterium]